MTTRIPTWWKWPKFLVSLIILFWLTKPQISLSSSHYINWRFMTGCFFLKYIEVDLKAKSKLDSLHSCLCALNCTGFLPPCLQHFPKCLNVTHPETKLVMSLAKSVSVKCESLWHWGDCIPPAWRPVDRRHSLSALGQKKTFKAWRKKMWKMWQRPLTQPPLHTRTGPQGACGVSPKRNKVSYDTHL